MGWRRRSKPTRSGTLSERTLPSRAMTKLSSGQMFSPIGSMRSAAASPPSLSVLHPLLIPLPGQWDTFFPFVARSDAAFQPTQLENICRPPTRKFTLECHSESEFLTWGKSHLPRLNEGTVVQLTVEGTCFCRWHYKYWARIVNGIFWQVAKYFVSVFLLYIISICNNAALLRVCNWQIETLCYHQQSLGGESWTSLLGNLDLWHWLEHTLKCYQAPPSPMTLFQPAHCPKWDCELSPVSSHYFHFSPWFILLVILGVTTHLLGSISYKSPTPWVC